MYVFRIVDTKRKTNNWEHLVHSHEDIHLSLQNLWKKVSNIRNEFSFDVFQWVNLMQQLVKFSSSSMQGLTVWSDWLEIPPIIVRSAIPDFRSKQIARFAKIDLKKFSINFLHSFVNLQSQQSIDNSKALNHLDIYRPF